MIQPFSVSIEATPSNQANPGNGLTHEIDPGGLADLVGRELGLSEWMTVSQERIQKFADATDDQQFIHVTPERARTESPFGGTIAHGFLLLSLLSSMAYEAVPRIKGELMAMNYGFEKVRFLSPVKSGSRVRGRFALNSYEQISADRIRLQWSVQVEVEGAEKPALVADWLGIIQLSKEKV